MNPQAVWLCAALSVAASPVAAGASNLAEQVDALHARRDDPAALAEARRLLDRAVAQAPSDHAVLWRAARLYFWLSDDRSIATEERSRLGKTGWEIAERAIRAKPDHPAGHYWAAVNMGNYAIGLGVVRALTMGLEGKFRERLSRAEQLAPGYEHGAIDVAWGRFYEKLPWPKRDRKRAEAHLRKVLEVRNPHSLRARVFLADTLRNTGRTSEARRLLAEVMAAVPGRYDAPEERRSKALAAALLAELDGRN